jgi:hypothetical protein
MFINLFSSGSEHPTYVVAMAGAAIWFSYRIEEGRTAGFRWLIPFVLVFAGLGPTDLFTKDFREFMIRYSLKALPFAIVWICLLKDLLVKDFRRERRLLNVSKNNEGGAPFVLPLQQENEVGRVVSASFDQNR